jgi:hypothetical protein
MCEPIHLETARKYGSQDLFVNPCDSFGSNFALWLQKLVDMDIAMTLFALQDQLTHHQEFEDKMLHPRAKYESNVSLVARKKKQPFPGIFALFCVELGKEGYPLASFRSLMIKDANKPWVVDPLKPHQQRILECLQQGRKIRTKVTHSALEEAIFIDALVNVILLYFEARSGKKKKKNNKRR